ncbi:MAG: DUF2273 domain-containing protein [Bacillota bacterium]
MSDWKQQFRAYLSEHKWSVLLVLAGIVISILIFTINFWRTLLLCLIVGVCFFIGSLMDKGGWELVKSFLDRVLPKR